jgi:hypothetical protein
LVEAVETWVHLYYPDDKGITNHDRFTQIEQQTGEYPGPSFVIPPDLAYLWAWFIELSGSRGGGWGPAPITYLEIKSWCDLFNITLEPWELNLIKAMDVKYLTIINEKSKSKSKT